MIGKALVISGPSGVGKDTIIDRWKELDSRVQRVVAYTTRKPREGEKNGVAYHFVSREEFDRMAAEGAFLEFKEVHGNGYATPFRDLEALIAAGKIAILKIDVQGAEEARKKIPHLVTIFLLPPSWEELERRIRGRNTEDEATIEKRLRNAKQELAEADEYDYRIINEDVEQTVAKIRELAGEN